MSRKGRVALKRCCTCKQHKPPSEFNKDRSNKDGLRHYCRECHNERSAAYRAANLEKVRPYDRARSAAYRAANLEKVRAHDRERHKANPERRRADRALRRARKRGALSPSHSVKAELDLIDTARLASRFDPRKPFVVDHIKPLARGGKHHHRNLRYLPARLNSIKGAKLDREVTDPEFHEWLKPGNVFEQVTYVVYRPPRNRC